MSKLCDRYIKLKVGGSVTFVAKDIYYVGVKDVHQRVAIILQNE